MNVTQNPIVVVAGSNPLKGGGVSTSGLKDILPGFGRLNR